MEILQVLWARGPSTVREVYEVLHARKPIGHTTVLKLMQIMAAKGLVERDESQRAHRYRPRVPAEKTQRQLIAHLLERAFQGSALNLVMQALDVTEVSPEELSQIRSLLDEIERRRP
jgi:predicted transcriptional regulator